MLLAGVSPRTLRGAHSATPRAPNAERSVRSVSPGGRPASSAARVVAGLLGAGSPGSEHASPTRLPCWLGQRSADANAWDLGCPDGEREQSDRHPPRGVRPPRRPLARPGPDRLGSLLVPARRRRTAGGTSWTTPSSRPPWVGVRRSGTVPSRSATARVEVLDAGGEVVAEARTADRAWVWVEGLEPDTAYRYRIHVDGREWAAGPALGLGAHRVGRLRPRAGQAPTTCGSAPSRPRTAATPLVRFVAMGDYGVGIKSDSESSRRQRRIAEVLDELVRQPRRPLRAVAGRQHLPGRAGAGRRRERRGGRRLVLQLLPALPLRHLPGPGVPRDRQPRHDRHRGQRRPGADGGQLPRPRALPQRSRTARRWGRGCSTASATAGTSS